VPVGWATPRDINANTLSGGNPQLNPESSYSWTVGAVLTPAALPSFSFSVDYWKIELTDAIESIDSETIVTRCYDSPTLDNPFCPLFTRGTALDPHEISVINVTNVNIGRLETDGIDFAAAYGLDLGDLSERWGGRLDFSLVASHLRSYEQQVDSGDPNTLLVSTGEVQYPKWRGTFTVRYDNALYGVSLATRYVGSSRFDVQAPRELYAPSGGGERVYNDVLGTLRFGEKHEAHFGISNIFAVEPPYTSNTFSGRPAGFYDLMGRTFFAGVNLRL
jgi:iron complex outermembrane receptor protein